MRRIIVSELYFRAFKRNGHVIVYYETLEDLSLIESERIVFCHRTRDKRQLHFNMHIATIVSAQNQHAYFGTEGKRIPVWKLTIKDDCEILDI